MYVDKYNYISSPEGFANLKKSHIYTLSDDAHELEALIYTSIAPIYDKLILLVLVKLDLSTDNGNSKARFGEV